MRRFLRLFPRGASLIRLPSWVHVPLSLSDRLHSRAPFLAFPTSPLLPHSSSATVMAAASASAVCGSACSRLTYRAGSLQPTSGKGFLGAPRSLQLTAKLAPRGAGRAGLRVEANELNKW